MIFEEVRKSSKELPDLTAKTSRDCLLTDVKKLTVRKTKKVLSFIFYTQRQKKINKTRSIAKNSATHFPNKIRRIKKKKEYLIHKKASHCALRVTILHV